VAADRGFTDAERRRRLLGGVRAYRETMRAFATEQPRYLVFAARLGPRLYSKRNAVNAERPRGERPVAAGGKARTKGRQ